ncbi:MAG: hypothetical protein M1839_007207 [Geoglossum umbratile]|nr:MAG: hypothetical protein M1839_007207 [Geoglossum umbratile]
MGDNEAISQDACPGVTGARTSDFRLGFALVLLKSKPPTVTLRDYVFNLRRHIRQGTQADSAANKHLHLDSLQFWKEQYDTLKSSEMELKKKVFTLEKQLVTERAARALGAGARRPHEKQKDSDADVAGHKGQALQNDSIPGSQPSLGEMDDFGTAFNASSPATDMVPLMRQVSHLHRLMKLSNCNISELSTTLICASSSMARMLSSICTTTRERKDITPAATCRARGANRVKSSSQEMEDRQVGDVFKGSFKIFNYLLKGLNIIASSNMSVSQGKAIYSLVRLFVNVMDCLSVGSTAEAPTSRGLSRTAPKKARGQGAVNGNSLPTTPRAEDIHMRLSQFLINMIAVLDLTQKGHAELYEGFQYALFTRIGQRLSFFVFGEELPNSSLDEPREDKLKGRNHSEEQDTASRQVEAWHLIWLLERVMVDLHDSNPACKLLGRATHASGRRDAQSLLHESKARIRSTLLKGVFGEDAEEFDGLKMPALPNGSRCGSMDGIQEELSARLCTPELFVQEAWRLVGWQILAGDDLF